MAGNLYKQEESKLDFNKMFHWRHNERDGVSNRRRLHCLLNRLLRRRSKKTSKLLVTGPCEGNPPVTGGLPHEGAVTRKVLDDVIMYSVIKQK